MSRRPSYGPAPHPVVSAVTACMDAARDNDRRAAATGTCPTCGATHPTKEPAVTETAYLAGPMTGYPDFNYPAFNDAAARLRASGWRVINPTETDAKHGWRPGDHDPDALTDEEYRTVLRHGLRAALADEVTCCVVLRRWLWSRGALAEVSMLRTLRLPVYEYAPADIDDGEPPVLALPPHEVDELVALGWRRNLR